VGVVNAIGERLPKGWGDAFKQVGLFVLADLCYETVRGIAEGKAHVAFANANKIVDVEKATGTFFEADFQSALLSSQWLIETSNWLYMNTHFVITTAFLVWLYLFRNEAFYFVRNMFLVAMALALVGYTLFPTAPPRLLPELGFVDTITDFSQVNHDSALVKIFVNPYAAVPSMHIAFALMIAIPAVQISRHVVSKVAWALYPLLVLFVVIVTANHFWLDAAAGALVAGVAALVAHRLLASYGPGEWAWHPARAPA
jgi:membrane-associated phospholipid phosphatase